MLDRLPRRRLATACLALAALGVARPCPAVGPRVLPSTDARGTLAPRPRLVHAWGEPLTERTTASPADVARAFALAHLVPAGELEVLSSVAGGGGVTFVVLEQHFDGVPVALGRVACAVDAGRRVVAAHAGEIAPRGPVGAPRAAASPVALRDAALRAIGREPGAALAANASVEPVLSATSEGCTRARRWRLATADAPFERHVVVVSEDGDVLRRDPAVFSGIAAAHVFPVDPEAGPQPRAWVELPDPVLRPSVDSPAGWCFSQDTTGWNVWAQLDREGDFFPPFGPVAVASGDPPVLDFPFTGVPGADGELALTNVFWALNDAHDRFRRLGFDESSGAMQLDNFGRGGVPDDLVWALVQFASEDATVASNRTLLSVGPDGRFTYLLVGLHATPAGLRDAALDTTLLHHEYAHGVTTRMVGNDPACLGGFQPAALAEGWSDFFAASFTNSPVVGAWIAADRGVGLRRASLDDNALGLDDLCGPGCDPHADGEAWSGTLWDLRRTLVDQLGSAGVETAERLVVEALRYTPCRPTFLQARDGVLLADAALHGGGHHCLLWDVFAARGLGWSASAAGPDELPVPAADPPPQCAGGGSLRLDAAEYATDDEAVAEVLDALARPGDPVTLATSGGDAESATLSAVTSGPALRASFALRPGAVVVGDGVVQVASEEVVTARLDARGLSAMASVSDAAEIVVLHHVAWGAWCQVAGDDDEVPGWPALTRFLDAGEQANIVVRLGNATPADLREAEVLATSRHPGVRVLPSTPIPVGTVRARRGTQPEPFDVEIRAQAAPDVLPGEVAEIDLELRARGRVGRATLQLVLSQDYVVEPDLSPFAGGVETLDDATSPTAGQWMHAAAVPGADAWEREACAGNGAPWGLRNGSLGCGPYPDGQAAALLLSPPLFPALPADAVALRITHVSWSAWVDLFMNPDEPYCDVDLVAAFLTDDPTSLPLDDPADVFDHAPLRAWHFRDNTAGWVTQGPWHVDPEPLLLDRTPGVADLRLAWVFWGDTQPCALPADNAGRFLLDDVSVRYDLVRRVPEAAPCTVDGALRVELAADPPGPKCPGEAFTLRVTAVESVACAGAIRFTYAGPGVPADRVGVLDRESPAVGEDGATYSVHATCETSPSTDDYRTVTNDSPARPGLGGPAPGSLRVGREADDLLFSWHGAAVPPTYGLYHVTRFEQLGLPSSAWALLARVDGEGPRGEGAWRDAGGAARPGFEAFRVHARDPCTDEVRVP
jgi:hypothetical protein